MKTKTAEDMKGSVVSKGDDFGFATTEKGESVYFNHRSLDSSTAWDSFATGDKIEFQMKPTPRGFAATNITRSIGYTCFLKSPIEIITRNADPFRPGDFFLDGKAVDLQSCWYKDPNQGKDELIDGMRKAGANALFNMQTHRRTFSEGNYNYTMHSTTAAAVTFFKESEVDSKAEAESLNAGAEEFAEKSLKALTETKEILDKYRKEQESPTGIFMIVVTITIVITFLYFIF